MPSHAPQNYNCPICLAIQGAESKDTFILQNDIIFKDEVAIVFLSSFKYSNHPIQPIISPIKHYENLYDIPDADLTHIHILSRKIALATKQAYNCDGISIRQNNEPAGDQHAFHYHLHVFPRFNNDDFANKLTRHQIASKEERASSANLIRTAVDRANRVNQ